QEEQRRRVWHQDASVRKLPKLSGQEQVECVLILDATNHSLSLQKLPVTLMLCLGKWRILWAIAKMGRVEKRHSEVQIETVPRICYFSAQNITHLLISNRQVTQLRGCTI